MVLFVNNVLIFLFGRIFAHGDGGPERALKLGDFDCPLGMGNRVGHAIFAFTDRSLLLCNNLSDLWMLVRLAERRKKDDRNKTLSPPGPVYILLALRVPCPDRRRCLGWTCGA
jgi:hypothetical protein